MPSSLGLTRYPLNPYPPAVGVLQGDCDELVKDQPPGLCAICVCWTWHVKLESRPPSKGPDCPRWPLDGRSDVMGDEPETAQG